MNAVVLAGVASGWYYVVQKKKTHAVLNDWENPTIVSKNREDAHELWQLFASIELALTTIQNIHVPLIQASTRLKYLHGTWQFKLATMSEWKTIQVPGCWQTQGYDVAIYTNIKYPFPRNPPYVPKENPIGEYRLEFDVESDFERVGRRILLHFDGVDSCFHCWLNGTFVGYSTDSRLPCDFDVTTLLQQRNNTLEVRVYRWSCSSYLEDQDMWNFSGIQRDVYLQSIAEDASVFDYKWTCSIDDYLSGQSAYGRLDVEVKINSYGSMNSFEGFDYVLQLYDDQSSLIVETILDAQLDRATQMNKFNQMRLSSTMQVKHPKLWTAEIPSLYVLIIGIRKRDTDEYIQVETCDVGFRKVEIRHGNVLINNRAVYFYGVNHHEHSDLGGKTVSLSFLEREIVLMKQNNFNAVRMSHYPQHSYLYRLCDYYGLYVIDEANIETHGFMPHEETLANCPDWNDSYMQRLQRMYHRDKNFPSIISWSLGNESGYGSVHDLMAQWIRQEDPTRFVHYEPATNAPLDTSPTDIFCPMYDRIEAIIQKVEDANHTKPLILCEYSHAMGNSNGNLYKYWEAIRQHPRLQGGFIWDWQDQGLTLYDAQRKEYYWGYGGDTGDASTPHDSCFNCNGIVLPDLTPHPAMAECKKVFQPITCNLSPQEKVSLQLTPEPMLIIPVDVYNRQFFQGTSNLYEIKYEVLQRGQVIFSADTLSVSFDLLPLESKTFYFTCPLLNLIQMEQQFDANLLIYVSITLKHSTTYAPIGYEIAWNELFVEYPLPEESASKAVIPDSISSFSPSFMSTSTQGLMAREFEDALHVQGAEFEVSFSPHKYGMYSFKFGRKKQLSLVDSVTPNFWRALTDNDNGGYTALWKRFGLHQGKYNIENTSMEWNSNDTQGTINVKCSYDLRPHVLRSSSDNLNSDDFVTEVIDPAQIKINTNYILDQLEKLKADDTRMEFTFPEHVTPFRRLMIQQYAEAFGLEYTADKHEPIRVYKVGNSIASSLETKAVFHCELNYVVHSNGTVEQHVVVEPCNKWPCLPRVGLNMLLPNELFRTVTWYGKGPGECYPDRNLGYRTMVHEKLVENMFFPYIRPSENGSRADMRWISLTGEDHAPGLFISKVPVFTNGNYVETDHLFQGSALPFTNESLEEAAHVHELSKSDHTSVNLDHALAGVGGDDSWSPCTHAEFLVPAQRYEFGFLFRAFIPKQQSPAEIYEEMLHVYA